jgi:hypothetical protein
MNGADATPTLEDALRRLAELTTALDGIGNGRGKEAAQELLELVLDLHALGLARICAVIGAAENATALTERLVGDPYARAILLLHGLHPKAPEERLREAIERMRPQWDDRGFSVHLLSASSGSARVRVHKNGSGEQVDLLRSEVEGVLVDAAPDLDDFIIEIENARAATVPAN